MLNENLIKFDERMADNVECLNRQLKREANNPERIQAINAELARVTAIRADLSAQISELVINNWDFNL